MARRSYSRTRPETEIEKIKRLFTGDFDRTEMQAEYTMDGKILKLITNNPQLQALMRAEGFTES